MVLHYGHATADVINGRVIFEGCGCDGGPYVETPIRTNVGYWRGRAGTAEGKKGGGNSNAKRAKRR